MRVTEGVIEKAIQLGEDWADLVVDRDELGQRRGVRVRLHEGDFFAMEYEQTKSSTTNSATYVEVLRPRTQVDAASVLELFDWLRQAPATLRATLLGDEGEGHWYLFHMISNYSTAIYNTMVHDDEYVTMSFSISRWSVVVTRTAPFDSSS